MSASFKAGRWWFTEICKGVHEVEGVGLRTRQAARTLALSPALVVRAVQCGRFGTVGRNPSTWSFIKDIKGDITTVVPSFINAGT